jgi:hypothetical protein
LISDSGYESEITSVAVASQQVEVFSKVLKTSIGKFVKHGIEKQHNNLNEIIVTIFLKKFISSVSVFFYELGLWFSFLEFVVPRRAHLPLLTNASQLTVRQRKE